MKRTLLSFFAVILFLISIYSIKLLQSQHSEHNYFLAAPGDIYLITTSSDGTKLDLNNAKLKEYN